MTRQRFGLVVEVDEQGLAEAGLDEAVGVPVERGRQVASRKEPDEIVDEHLAFEVGDRSGLRGRHVGGVTDREDVLLGRGLQGRLVRGHEVEVVAETCAATHIFGATVQRHDDGQIERHFAAVVTDEPAADTIDLAGVELADEVDVLLLQQRGERRRGDRLCERAVERRGVSDLDLVADAATFEVPVGQEAELERGDWTLDGHVDDVDHKAAAFEIGQGGLECCGTR